MYCVKCGAALENGNAFCSGCGADNRPSVPAATSSTPATVVAERDTRPCPYCGEYILLSAIKCRFCGSMLNGGAMLAQAPGAITLNAPAPVAPLAGAAGAAAPFIVIQNVVAAQAPQRPVFVHPVTYKNPALALFLSFIFPGAGQFYNGHAGKGFLVLFTFWILGITYIWSLFDAYLSAQRINRVGF
jgi:TM2 domain-containing membrane protein YozV/predicted RNA-binding Zn-ribbon protein involved in translation (DUF1610 family)